MIRIVCAAMHNTATKELILSVRHWDVIAHWNFGLICEKNDNSAYHKSCWVQGFVDNKGIFHTREEAFKIATKASQILYKTGGENSVQLFSEDLY